MHPTPYTGFFEEVQRVYRRVVPEWGDPSDRPTEEKNPETKELIDGTGLVEEAVVRRYPWSRRCSRDLYLRLLNTYSDHRGLDEARRAELYSGIGALIDEGYGGPSRGLTYRSCT